MKKYAFYDVDSKKFLHNLVFVARSCEFLGIPAEIPTEILYYDSVEEPLQIVNFLADISDGQILLTVAEVEVND